MHPRTLSIMLVAGLAASSATARLGETPEQIKARYGEPARMVKGEDPRINYAVFQSRGFEVTVTFLDGKSQGESFKKPPGLEWSEAEMQAVLAANASDHKWTPVDSPVPGRAWKLEDLALAHLDGAAVMTVTTPQLEEFMKSRKPSN